MLRGERQQRRDAEGDARRNGLGPDPERDPRHDDDQTRRPVRVEQVIAQPALERKHNLQAAEVTCARSKNKTPHFQQDNSKLA